MFKGLGDKEAPAVVEQVVVEVATMAEVGPEVLLAAEVETAAADLADQGELEEEAVEAETDKAHLGAADRAELEVLEVLAVGAVMALVVELGAAVEEEMALVQAERAVAAVTALVVLAAAHLEVLEGAGVATAQVDQEAETVADSVAVGSVVAAAEAQEELAMRQQKRSHGKPTCSIP